MEFKSEQKYLILSPRKIRPVVDVIKKMTPMKALDALPFIKKRASEFLFKVIKSAIANAQQTGADINSLVFKEIQIGEGPRLRRGQPVSRGRWHPIKKRMSHIRVVLTTRKLQIINNKLQTSSKSKEIKTETKKPTAKKTVVEIQPKGYRKTIKNGTKS